MFSIPLPPSLFHRLYHVHITSTSLSLLVSSIHLFQHLLCCVYCALSTSPLLRHRFSCILSSSTLSSPQLCPLLLSSTAIAASPPLFYSLLLLQSSSPPRCYCVFFSSISAVEGIFMLFYFDYLNKRERLWVHMYGMLFLF